VVNRALTYSFFLGLFLAVLLGSTTAFAHNNSNTAYFVPNNGQWPVEVKAMYAMPGSKIFITDFGLRIVSQDHSAIKQSHDARNYDLKIGNFVYDMRLVGAKLDDPEQIGQLDFSFNFFLGQDASKWAADVRPVKQLIFKSVYPGIDLVFKTKGDFLKYEFEVAPGADPHQINWELSGLDPELLRTGEIRYSTPFGQMIEEKPLVFQQNSGVQQLVKARFYRNKNFVGFKLGKYDKSLHLIIDPALVFATFSGSTVDNWGFSATSDGAGNGYLGGVVSGMGYPTSVGAFDDSYNLGQWDISISKFSTDGQNLLYSTYLGGNQDEYPMSMITDTLQQLVILGKTRSNDFPVSATAYDNQYNGAFDLVLTKLNASGSALIGSTYIGGTANDGHNRLPTRSFYQGDSTALEYNYGDDSRGEVVLDASFNIYVASNTSSTDFPTQSPLQGLSQGQQDAVLFKFNPTLSTLIYSTYLGGSNDDAAYGLAVVEPLRTVIVVGGTKSANFVNISVPGYDNTFNGGTDGWLLSIGANGNTLAARSFVGTSLSDQVFLVQVDDQNRVYVVGQSRGSMPVLPANIYNNGGGKHFIQRYNASLTQLEFSTTVGPTNGSSPSLSPTALLVDLCRRVYLAGWGGNANSLNPSLGSWPLSANAFQSTTDGADFYFMVLDSNASGLLYASYFGGSVSEHVDGGTSRFNSQGVVYQAVCAGCGGSSNFPVTPGAYSTTNNSTNCNAAIFKFDMEIFRPVASFVTQYPDTPVCQLVPVLFQSTGTANATYFWDFGIPGATSTLPNPAFTYTTAGLFTVTLIVSNCVGSDTIRRNVNVFPPANIDLSAVPMLCANDTIAVQVSGANSYRWLAQPGLLDTTGNAPRFTGSTSTWLYLWAANTVGCEIFDSVLVLVIPDRLVLPDTVSACLGGGVFIQPNLGPEVVAFAWEANPAIANVNQAAQQLNPAVSTYFYLLTSDTAGCTQRDSMWVNIQATVFANAGPDRYVCSNDSFVLTARGGQRYLWSTGDTATTLRFPAQAAGIYWLIAYNDSCRSLPDTIRILRNEIEANFVFSPDTGYAPAKMSFINRTTGDGVGSFQWDFGDGYFSTEASPSHVYRQPGEYSVQLIATNAQTGCSDTLDYNYIFVDSIVMFIPNAFTPNGDGLNDLFKVLDRNFLSFDIWIYNRWGQLVFQSNDPKFGWDGRLNGELLQSGNYPYLIRGLGKNAKPFQFEGEIRLLR